MEDKEIDREKDIEIDFAKHSCRYIRFDGRYNDNNLDFDETISVMIPAVPDTTNILVFQLVLLENEQTEQDYVVGWGAFPLMNADFALNEGKYKIPLLFGNINPNIAKFSDIEKRMGKDIDNWLCNAYFEIEKINLMDVKVEEETLSLFYRPVIGGSTMEQQ